VKIFFHDSTFVTLYGGKLLMSNALQGEDRAKALDTGIGVGGVFAKQSTLFRDMMPTEQIPAKAQN
jgi:hypothetical protein